MLSPMTWKASMVGWTKASVGMETCPVFVGTMEKVNRDIGAIGAGVEKFAIVLIGRGSVRVRGFEWVKAKVETESKGAKAA